MSPYLEPPSAVSAPPGPDDLLQAAKTEASSKLDSSAPTLRPDRLARTKLTGRTGLGIYLSLILVSLVATTLVIDRTIVAVEGGLHDITYVKEPARAAAYEMEVAILGAGLGVRKYLATGDPDSRARFEKDLADFERFRVQFQKLALTPQEVNFDRRLGALFSEYRTLGQTLITMSDEERPVSAELARALSGLDDLLDRELGVRVNSRTAGGAAFAKIAQGIDAEMGEAGTWLGSYQRTARLDDRWRLLGKIRRVRDQLGGLKALKLSSSDRAFADELTAATESALALIEKIVSSNRTLLENQNRFTDLRDSIDDLLDDELQISTAAGFSAAADPASRSVRTLRWTNFGLCAGVLVIGLWAASAILRRSGQLAVANRELCGQIAEREKAEQARARLHEKLVSAQEEERRRLARELHDEVGQQLAAIKLGLRRIETDGDKPGQIAEARRLADLAIEQTRKIAWELRPAMLDDLGLESALLRYVETWSLRTSVVVDPVFKLSGGRLPQHIETTAFRIVQEALNNVLKHADAHSVSIIVEQREGHVQIVVEDDGRGFDPNVPMAADSPRLGLLGMRERATLAGGVLEIESRPGSGTTIAARFPLGERPSPAS